MTLHERIAIACRWIDRALAGALLVTLLGLAAALLAYVLELPPPLAAFIAVASVFWLAIFVCQCCLGDS